MKTTVEIQNLKCGGCASTISNKLSQIQAITNVEVNVDQSTVSFDYESESVIANVKNELKKIGYPVVGEENALVTKAKSYVSCAIGKIS